MIARAKNLKPVTTRDAQIMTNPASYQKPERFIDDDMPRGGKGGGYAKQLKKVTGLKTSAKATFLRPAVPKLTDAAVELVADHSATYIAEALDDGF
jgi:hypothetical protein